MSRKMIDYQVEDGKISTIDGYKVGGDEITADKVNSTIAQQSNYGFYTEVLDNKILFHALGRFKPLTQNVFKSCTIPAGSYKLGQEVEIERELSISGIPIALTNTGYTTYPLISQERPTSEPVWEIIMKPAGVGSIYLAMKCIREGTYAEPKTFNSMYIGYLYLKQY